MVGPTGNYYDKFNTTNPIARHLMNGFKSTFANLYMQTGASSVLEVGCGEGHMLELMHSIKPPVAAGIDIDLAILEEAASRSCGANLALADAHELPYPDRSFDLVIACEVLEHVRSPQQVLTEMSRVSRHTVIVSVPREPLWRVLNLARGYYVGTLGNTPGHIHHWSSRTFVQLLRCYFEIVEIERPLPWTMVLCRCA